MAPTIESKGRRVTLHGAARGGQRSTVKVKYEFGEKVIEKEAVVSTEIDDFKGVIFPLMNCSFHY